MGYDAPERSLDHASRGREKKWLFMSHKQLATTIAVAIALAGVLYPLYADISLWIGVGIVTGAWTVADMALANRWGLPLLHLGLIIAVVQLILAAWGNWYYPVGDSSFDLGPRLAEYLTYGGPVCLALALGLFLPLLLFSPSADPPVPQLLSTARRQRLTTELNWYIGIGFIATLLIEPTPFNLRFFTILIAYLRYVGLFGFIILRLPGWQMRALLVLGLEFALTLQSGMFHHSVLWGTSFIFILAYAYQWRARKVLTIVMAGLIAVLMLQSVKIEFRKQFWYSYSAESDNRLTAFSKIVLHALSNPFRIFTDEHLTWTMARLNHGWIVNQVMLWTPSWEPYAQGETIKRAVYSSLVPRVLKPDKFRVGGIENFERFTGRKLLAGTSMDLGFAGEMYANYGPSGGLVGVVVYGLIIGVGYRWFYGHGMRQPLWWAWLPFVAVFVVKAESSIGFVLNWLVKAVVVMALVLFCSPGMRRALFTERKAGAQKFE